MSIDLQTHRSLSYRRASTPANPHRLLIFSHGVGGNETELASFAEGAPADAAVVLVRAPLTLGPGKYAWFPVAFGPQGPRQDSRAAAASAAEEQGNLATFDDLDYNVFSNQKWDELSRSHAQDVIVHWPDGHVTDGIDVHIEDLKKLFVHAPDTRIKHHEHKLAQDGYTAVTGLMEGTFTQPMLLADGSLVQPTGKSFSLPMATIGRWENGVMREEWLFWDNATYMRQIGVRQ